MATQSDSEKSFRNPPAAALPPLPSLFQNTSNPSAEESGSFKQIFGIIQRRILLITSVAFAVGSAVTLQSLKTPIVYQGSFRLLVEPVKTTDKLDGLTNSYGGRGQRTALDYETQIQILRSPQLISKIIEIVF